MMALNPNVKNYFYDVLPLDIQEHIFNINKKETLQKCFNAIYNLKIDRVDLENELKRRQRNIYNNYKQHNCSHWDVGEWRRSPECREKQFKYLEKRMQRLKKYKIKINIINEEFKKDGSSFSEMYKERKMSYLLSEYIKNDYIIYDYDDELLNYDEYTLFINNLEI